MRLLIRVAECAPARGEARVPVRGAAWVEAHVAAARRLFEAHHVTVEARQETFAPERCDLLTAADRDSLAEHAAATATGAGQPEVMVLVMPRVRDLEVLTYDLMGVHWRYGGSDEKLRGRRWTFLTARAVPPVLAHELGHYFGLPHDPAGGNLMTPGASSPLWRSDHPPRPSQALLTAAQARRLRDGLERFSRQD